MFNTSHLHGKKANHANPSGMRREPGIMVNPIVARTIDAQNAVPIQEVDARQESAETRDDNAVNSSGRIADVNILSIRFHDEK